MCFEDNDIDAVLFMDASNAFNSLNRQAALRKHPMPYPGTSTYQHISRQRQAVHWEEHILSQEGTTQSDPFAMAMYAIGTLPIIQELQGDVPQSWYMDNAAAEGKLTSLRTWWGRLETAGPHYG